MEGLWWFERNRGDRFLSRSKIWEMRRPKWCTRWPNGKDWLWPITTSNRDAAFIPILGISAQMRSWETFIRFMSISGTGEPRVITDEEDRNINFLKEIITICRMIRTEYMVYEMYPQSNLACPRSCILFMPKRVVQAYMWLEPKDREHAICQKYGRCSSSALVASWATGKKHDGRAPDCDDYTTKGLNDLPG